MTCGAKVEIDEKTFQKYLDEREDFDLYWGEEFWFKCNKVPAEHWPIYWKRAFLHSEATQP